MNHIPKLELTELETKQRKCKCLPRCEEYFNVDGFDIYCKGTLEQFAVSILNQVNGTNIAQGNLNNRGWTTRQEQQIIKYVESNGVKFGTYRIIGEMIGKPREAVKRKVYDLEKQGRLKRK